ncbi:TPA_asm: maturation protein [ssRNA phage SRR7976299_12]|uniref:Maturation protein n=1 Tax=ssRNA phage SRR7976299_12 TaxID=2786634 RepID=A0A8S5L4P3_9VIRU|nr:maturation protein [ssRNA phage SRR7976299_12]DAD52649.1 TPA_asm: maturation protein [ssRNA phage SRR7976299_12]
MSSKPRKAKAPYVRVRDQSFTQSHSGRRYTWTILKSNSSKTVDWDVFNTYLVKQVDKMTDTVTPGLESIISRGGIVNTPMSRIRSSYNIGVSDLMGTEDGVGWLSFREYYFAGQLLPYHSSGWDHLPSGFSTQNLINLASTSAYAAMKSSNFQGLVTAAEAKKTLDFLHDPLKEALRLLTWLNQLKKGKINLKIREKGNLVTINGKTFTKHKPRYTKYRGPGTFVRVPTDSLTIAAGKALSGTVLSYNLGFKPLMMDLNALLKEIPKLHEVERTTSRGRASDSEVLNQSVSIGHGPFTFSGSIHTERSVKVRAYTLIEDSFSISEDFGVSLWDVPPAAWEMITASFIADYFANIGEYLQALTEIARHNIRASGYTVETTIKSTRTWTGVASKPSTWTISSVPTGVETRESYEKVRVPNLQGPALAIRPIERALRPAASQNILSLITTQLIKLAK